MKKNPWIAAVLNFFFMGLGTLYIGRRKLTGLGLTLGAIALTYVELQLKRRRARVVSDHVCGSVRSEYCSGY